MPAARRFSKFIYLQDHNRKPLGSSKPGEYWVHPDEIAYFTITCLRTPSVCIRLRSRSEKDPAIEINGPEAKALIDELRASAK